MTAPAKEKSDVAKRIDAGVAELRQRNQMIAQIRGTQWGLGIDSVTTRAVAHYCLENGLDPVRHVEVLGGRIYLTAEFYEERAAPYIRNGEIIPHEPEFINVDPRLETLSSDPDPETAAWAKAERLRRAKARIEHNAPEAAVATCVRRCTIAATGKSLVGVNWCGGGTRKKYAQGGILKDADPIGDLEPTKTSITRAGRRMWKQVADVILDYGARVKPIEAHAAVINEGLEAEPRPGEVEVPAAKRITPGDGRDPYGLNGGEVKEPSKEEVAFMRERVSTGGSQPSARMKALLDAEAAGHPLNDDEREDLRLWHLDQAGARVPAPVNAKDG